MLTEDLSLNHVYIEFKLLVLAHVVTALNIRRPGTTPECDVWVHACHLRHINFSANSSEITAFLFDCQAFTESKIIIISQEYLVTGLSLSIVFESCVGD